MSKHTPGPCYSETSIDVQGEPQRAFEVYADDSKAQTLGFVFDEDRAMLLAAAPDMLAALHTCKVQLAPVIEAGTDKVTQTMWLIVCDAIAQAEGAE